MANSVKEDLFVYILHDLHIPPNLDRQTDEYLGHLKVFNTKRLLMRLEEERPQLFDCLLGVFLPPLSCGCYTCCAEAFYKRSKY